MKFHHTIEEAISRLGDPRASIFTDLLKNGVMKIEYYTPKKTDVRGSITRDEIYVIASGRSTFFRNGERIPAKPSDLLFVSAGTDFRFEEFTDDFATWLISYNPPELKKPSSMKG